MADSDKNIVISPQRGSATLSPTITFTGKGNDPITLRVTDADTGTLSFQGSEGQLFGISNSLSSGKIFSANYISGIPAIDVDASGLVRLAPLLGTVGIGTSSVTAGNIVDVGGNVRIDGDLSVTGTTNIPASTLDGINSTQFLRSDVNDTASGQITLTYGDQALVSQHDGSSLAWRGRILCKNATSNVASFLGTYGSVGGVFSHNNALNAWADLYVNTVDGSGGGIVRLPGSVLINGSQTWHAGNDGSGSGLDADLLDGINSSSFARNDIYNSVNSGFQVSRNIGSISGSWEDGNHTLSLENGDSGNIVLNFHRGGFSSHNLRYNGTTFNFDATITVNANTAWHAGNDGSGSGLDADLLDGINSSSFLRSDTNNTASGLITFQNSSDYQIILNGNGTTWAGILFADQFGNDTLFYHGSSSTFSIGGGGASVPGKKLHVDGGLTVGANVDAKAMPTNGIYSEGPIGALNTQWMAVAHYSYAGDVTGAIVINLPGTPGSAYSMPVIEITTYEYNSNAGTTYTISGHNWSTSSFAWYNTRCQVNGGPSRGIRLGRSGTNYVIVLGYISSGWNYIGVTVSVKHHPSYYATTQDFNSTWTTTLTTDLNAYTLSSDLTVTDWHSGNDGSGTGLDADLWDGYQLSTRTNWGTNSAQNIVVGQLSWRNYGNNHTIFDASNSLSPDGGAVNNTNAQIAWGATYPTLMGWNGATTYGVRVDSARNSDTVAGLSPTSANTASTVVSRDSGGSFSTYNVTAFGGIHLRRDNAASTGISWYAPSYTAWTTYMSPAGATGCGPTNNITAPSGSLVTTWGLRNFIENVGGYGWTFESGTSAGQPSVVAEIRASDGVAAFGGLLSTGNVGIGTINPSYKLHVVGTSSLIQRDLYISGNTGGNYSNRLVVGNTDTSFTLQDSNLRPTIQAHGAYPVLSLNHTQTSNASHGPTIQFTCNGTGNQFVIGTTGNGSRLDIGTASTGDWNPHNGISNHSGTTHMSFTTSGNVGVGTLNPTAKLEVLGSFSDTVGALRQTGSGQFMIATYEGGSTPVCFSLRGVNTGGDTAANFGVLNLDRNGNGVGGGAGLHFRRQNSSNNYIEYGGLYSAIQVNTAGNESGFLAFCTTHNGASRQERIRILSDGNVGINTTSPLQKLDVRGKFLLAADATTSTHITQVPYTINNGTLSWEGSAGQLFSITNNLTSGSIFSVNDVSGLPSIDVDADGTIKLAPYGGTVVLKQVTETVANTFTTTLAPSSGTFTVDALLGTVILGDLNASVTTWAFTNVPTANSRATTITLIIDGDTAQTYGDACTVNGSAISGGVKWSGGSAPTATNNFDIITFTIVRDSAGTTHVFGSGNTNFS